MDAARTVITTHADLAVEDPCACGVVPCALVGECLEQALLTDDRFGLHPRREARRLVVAA